MKLKTFLNELEVKTVVKKDYGLPEGIYELRDGLTVEKIENSFPWLLHRRVNMFDASIGYDKKTNKLIWYDGTWYDGEWVDGIWKKGDWKDGVWKDGIWESGEWFGGSFKKGIWKDGTFGGSFSNFGKDAIWQNGEFLDGSFYGKWYSGIWNNNKKYNDFHGEWLDPNNNIINGVIKFKNGLTNQIILDEYRWLLSKGVEIRNAVIGYNPSTKKLLWYKGDWLNGRWVDGIWASGIFKSGEWKDGTFLNGIFEKETYWETGNFKGGIFRSNDYFYGNWYGGKWESEYWKFSGEWLDPNNPSPN